jgi:hypothetical protein
VALWKPALKKRREDKKRLEVQAKTLSQIPTMVSSSSSSTTTTTTIGIIIIDITHEKR